MRFNKRAADGGLQLPPARPTADPDRAESRATTDEGSKISQSRANRMPKHGKKTEN